MLLPHNLFIITGANRGFGKAIAEIVAKRASVKTSIVLVGRDQSQLESIQFNQDKVTRHVIGNISLGSAVEAEKTVIEQLGDLIKVNMKPYLNNLPFFNESNV